MYGSMREEKVAKAAGDNKGKVTHTLHQGADSPAGCKVCPCVKKKDNKKKTVMIAQK